MRVLVLSLLLAVFAAGCAVVQEKTIGESLDDTATGTQIKTRLLTEGGIGRFGEADVVVSSRLALLVGRVPTEADRQEAERIAWTVKSVDEVANELVVDSRDILRDINDPWIAGQVRARLVGDDAIRGVNYNIHVFNGVVYLLGFARDVAELERAADHASRVSGVTKVISYVKVRDRAAPQSFAPPAPPSQAAAPQFPDSAASRQQAPAPIVAPAQPPTPRAAYSDPYAGAPITLPSPDSK